MVGTAIHKPPRTSRVGSLVSTQSHLTFQATAVYFDTVAALSRALKGLEYWSNWPDQASSTVLLHTRIWLKDLVLSWKVTYHPSGGKLDDEDSSPSFELRVKLITSFRGWLYLSHCFNFFGTPRTALSGVMVVLNTHRYICGIIIILHSFTILRLICAHATLSHYLSTFQPEMRYSTSPSIPF